MWSFNFSLVECIHCINNRDSFGENGESVILYKSYNNASRSNRYNRKKVEIQQLFAEPPSQYQLMKSWVEKQTFSLKHFARKLAHTDVSEKNHIVKYWDGSEHNFQLQL